MAPTTSPASTSLLLLLFAPLRPALHPPFYATPHGIGLVVQHPLSLSGAWVQPQPLELQTVRRDGGVFWTRGAYASVDDAGVATGTLTSPGGSVVAFVDTLANVTGGVSLSRRVTVVSVGAGEEVAFATQVSLPAPAALAAVPRQLFIPGVSYSNASALPRGALAGDPSAAHILVREDRLPLPLVAVVYAGAAGVAQLVHVRPDGSTIADEDFAARVVDAGLQFGSIGVVNGAAADGGALAVAFQFPGSEGDRTYVYPPAAGWANRSHPLSAGFARHSYAVEFKLWPPSADFAAAATRSWRDAWAAFAPAPPPSAPSRAQVWRDGAELLARVGVAREGVAAVPFEAALASGAVTDPSSQMGFVGRALPAAALLLRDALLVAPNASRARQAAALIDVWASRAMTPCGVPKTWFDLAGGGALAWRASDAYQGSLRVMTDGMAGLVRALALQPHNALWRAAVVAYADFLVARQGSDGALGAAYDWQCAPLSADTRATAFVVPFLLAAGNATGDARYAAAAVAAGAFAAARAAGGFVYAGGAVDNPDVPDREAGWLHAQAFVALYDHTRDARWLGPAAQAAAYAETFVYAWRVPVPCGQTPPNAFPCTRTSTGSTSVIATGQSGADAFMAVAWADFRRLGQWLRDDHFQEVADVLEGGAAQGTDFDGTLGYALRGLQHEAATLSVRRGAGVAQWLPWLTANAMEPIAQEGGAGTVRGLNYCI